MSSGARVSEDMYHLKLDPEEEIVADESSARGLENENAASDGETLHHKRIKSSNEEVENFKVESKRDEESDAASGRPSSPISSDSLHDFLGAKNMDMDTLSSHFKDVRFNIEKLS